MRSMRIHLIVIASAILGVLPASAAVAPPANDSFAAPQALTGESGEVVATSKEATKEAGEPSHAGAPGGASVWFSWTAERTGRLTVWTNRPAFDPVLGVYTGTAVDSLTEVASNDDNGASIASRVSFPVSVGTEYRIAVDGVDGTNGPFRLRWRQGPENDDFVDAHVLADAAGTTEGSVFGATAEPAEVVELNEPSTWYRWTAPETGAFGFHVRDALGLTVYTGTSVDALTRVGESGAAVTFDAVAGTEYSVRVAGFGWGNTFPFTLTWGPAPANDLFAEAAAISGVRGQATGSTAFASVEIDEPARQSTSVWYEWTAPATGYVRFDAWRLPHPIWGWVDTTLAVYRGTSVDDLTLLARNDDWFGTRLPAFGSAIGFRAVAGTTYSAAVDSFDGPFSWGSFALRWYPGAILFGSRDGDRLAGTAGRDYLDGRGGHDVIRGLGGNDVLVGGRGRDRLYGGDGADLLNSRDLVRGNDEIFGGAGRDRAVRDRRDRMHDVP